MRSFSERDSINPDNPEPDYTSLRLSERATRPGPLVPQRAGSELVRSSPIPRPALLARKAIDESARRTRDRERRAALLSVVTRTAAVAGVVLAAALLFMIMKPASRLSVASPTPSETTGSTPRSNQAGVESKPPLTEVKATVASPPGQPATPEQSQQLLQRFLQWREKASTTEASR
jgi:hypothetical protein